MYLYVIAHYLTIRLFTDPKPKAGLGIGKAPYIVIAPKNLPLDIRAKLEDAFHKAANSPEYKKLEKKLEMRPVNLSGKDLETFLGKHRETIEKILKELGKI